MGNKEIIYQKLKEKPMTANQVSKLTGIPIGSVKVCISRMKSVYNTIYWAGKVGREYVYSTYNKTDSEENNEYENVEHLKLLMKMFKENFKHLSKSKKILNFVFENESKFNEIEKVIEVSQK